MARTIQVSLSTLQEILGWNGAFLLLVIVSFKLFLAGQAAFTCPCNWNVAYATLMFLLPAFSIFTLACFTYFRQDNDSVPWKVLRKFYKKMCACNFYDETTDWDFHADHCIRCKPRKRDWSLVKVALSVVFSLLYPLAWLSISFLQATYYACARVGPEPNGILGYCDFDILDIAVYRKSYTQAANRSMLIGCIVFAVALFLLAVFLIVYGEIANYLRKVDSLFDVSGTQLQITVSAQPNRTSRTADSISKHDQREESGSRVKGGVRETIRDVRVFLCFMCYKSCLVCSIVSAGRRQLATGIFFQSPYGKMLRPVVKFWSPVQKY